MISEQEEILTLCKNLGKRKQNTAIDYYKIGEWLWKQMLKMPRDTSLKDIANTLPEDTHISYDIVCRSVKIYRLFKDKSESLEDMTLRDAMKMITKTKQQGEYLDYEESLEEIKTDENMEELIERIKNVKEKLRYSNKRLEAELQLANGYINDIERGKNKNPSKLIMALYNRFRISPNYLLVGEGPMSIPIDLLPEKKPITIVPLLRQTVSCGRGETLEDGDNIESYIRPLEVFPSLEGHGKIYAFRAKGVSMIGIGIQDGDILLFDGSPNQTVYNDDVYVFSLAGDVYCKLLRFEQLTGKICIYSVQNRDIRDAELLRTVDADSEDFRIFGRVLCWLHENRLMSPDNLL